MKKMFKLGMIFTCAVMLCACSPIGTSTEQTDEQAQTNAQQLLDSVTYEEIKEKNLPLSVMKRHESMCIYSTLYNADGQVKNTAVTKFILDGDYLINDYENSDGIVKNAAQGAVSSRTEDGKTTLEIIPLEMFNENIELMNYGGGEFKEESRTVENGELVITGTDKSGVQPNGTAKVTVWVNPETLIISRQHVEEYDEDGNPTDKYESVFAYDDNSYAMSQAAKGAMLVNNGDVCEITVIDNPAEEYPGTRTYTVPKGSDVLLMDITKLYTAYSDEACTKELTEAVDTGVGSITVYFAKQK